MPRPRKQAGLDHTGGVRAVVYVRVSTDEQKKGFGPESQREECQRYLARKGYTLIEATDDLGISGAKPLANRPGLQRAVALCTSGEADVIVVYAQDRLSRSNSGWETLALLARQGGWRLETAREGMDLTLEENEMPADLMAMFAALERKMIARRLRGGRRQRAKTDGRGSSYVPFGYHKTDSGVAVSPAEAKVIRKLFALRDAKKTYQQTANALNAAGMRAPRGGVWRPGQIAWIERRRDLYMTGRRDWDGITAAQTWPTILRPIHSTHEGDADGVHHREAAADSLD